MALDLDKIKSAFGGGRHARTNLFEVEIPSLDKDFKYRCKASMLPAMVVGTIEVGYMGRKIKVAGDRTYDEWTVTVYNDDEHNARDAFVEWQANCHGTGTSITGETPDVYKANATVVQFSRDGNEKAKYQVEEIWPMTVGELSFDWDETDTLQTFEVTFAIDYVTKL